MGRCVHSFLNDFTVEKHVSEFYEGLAEILEVDTAEVKPELTLGESWDSLAIVSTIALIDDVYDIQVRPEKLADCETVGDVEKLVAAEQGA
jgi:acyl carrier protein